MYTDFDRYNEMCRPFIDEGYITGFTRLIKKGKEATVLCCPADPSLGTPYLALKLYKDSGFRNFKHDSPYLDGKVWDKRLLKRMKTVKHGVWVETEYEVLKLLHQSGVQVPKPYLHIGQGILMDFIGEDGEDAPLLKNVSLDTDEALGLYRRIMDSIERMLRNNVVHGDLSAFNILYDGRDPVIIDFPQAIYISSHRDPFPLFCRDVDNIHSFFSRYGVADSGTERAIDLWSRYCR